MLEKLLSSLSGLWPTVLSAYQTAPWAFWVSGGLIIALIVYMATLPRRRREHVRKQYRFWVREGWSHEWRYASILFPGVIKFRPLQVRVKTFSLNGVEFNLFESDLEELRNTDTPKGRAIWEKEEGQQFDWLVTQIQYPARNHAAIRWAVLGLLLLTLGLIGTFVFKPAYREWLRDRQAAQVAEAPIPPTMPAPLACDEFGNCAEQGSDVAPTPEPEEESLKNEVKFEESTLVIDLSQPANRTPSAIEEKLNDWLSSLPAGPAIDVPIPQWVIDLFSTGDHTIIALGDDGFVIVSAWTHGLEYRRTDESLNQIGDKVSVYGNCGTIVAGEGKGKLRWGICHKSEWKVSKYAKGGYDVVVYDGGLVIDTKGFYPRWTPLWLLLIPLAAIGYLIWLRRR